MQNVFDRARLPVEERPEIKVQVELTTVCVYVCVRVESTRMSACMRVCACVYVCMYAQRTCHDRACHDAQHACVCAMLWLVASMCAYM